MLGAGVLVECVADLAGHLQEVFEAVKKDMERCAQEAGLKSFEQVSYFLCIMTSW